MKEFVIWGIPKGQNDEAILLSKFDGKPIVRYELAQNLVTILKDKYECKAVRIQELNLTDNVLDFKHTINF